MPRPYLQIFAQQIQIFVREQPDYDILAVLASIDAIVSSGTTPSWPPTPINLEFPRKHVQGIKKAAKFSDVELVINRISSGVAIRGID